MKFNSIEELLICTENIKGKTFEEIDTKNLLKTTHNLKRNKGILGHVVETGFYGYSINSNPKADFDEIGVELKVTGYIKSKSGKLRAKERVSLSKIDYFGIVDEDYEFSKLIYKNKKILFIWYLYEEGKDIKDFMITDYQLYDMGQDEEVFKNDFELIKNKIRNGLAHTLSEGDTSYLGACTKARTSKDRTKQPFSSTLAKPRAFSLKNSYMTGILNIFNFKVKNDLKNNLQKAQNSFKTINSPTKRNIISDTSGKITLKSSFSKNTNSKTVIKRLEDYNVPKEFKTVEDYVHDKIKPYIGKTQLEILEEITGKTYKDKIPKNLNKLISDVLIGKDSELPEKDDLFKKTSFLIKNLPLTPKGKPRERMSFRTISLSEFIKPWDESDWKLFFEETTLIVICYREPRSGSKNGERVLDGVKKISFNDDDLKSFEITYNMIRKTIRNVDISYLPTPNSFDGQYLVVAPKGVKGDDAYNNMFKQDKTKIAFMLTKEFLCMKINCE